MTDEVSAKIEEEYDKLFEERGHDCRFEYYERGTLSPARIEEVVRMSVKLARKPDVNGEVGSYFLTEEQILNWVKKEIGA